MGKPARVIPNQTRINPKLNKEFMKNDHGGFEPPMAPSAPSNKETIISKLEAIKKRIEDREQKTSWEDTQQTLRDLTVKYQIITSKNDHGGIVPPMAPSAPSNKDDIFTSALNIFTMSISLRKLATSMKDFTQKIEMYTAV